jgi:hypothetical protein
MSDTATNRHDANHCSDVQPGTIGRGTGYTIKQFRRALDNLMKRKGVPSASWRKPRSETVAPVISPIRKTDPWSLL